METSLDVEQVLEASGMKAARSIPLCVGLLTGLCMKGHLSLYSKHVRLDRSKIDGLLQQHSQKGQSCESKAIVPKESVP